MIREDIYRAGKTSAVAKRSINSNNFQRALHTLHSTPST